MGPHRALVGSEEAALDDGRALGVLAKRHFGHDVAVVGHAAAAAAGPVDHIRGLAGLVGALEVRRRGAGAGGRRRCRCRFDRLLAAELAILDGAERVVALRLDLVAREKLLGQVGKASWEARHDTGPRRAVLVVVGLDAEGWGSGGLSLSCHPPGETTGDESAALPSAPQRPVRFLSRPLSFGQCSQPAGQHRAQLGDGRQAGCPEVEIGVMRLGDDQCWRGRYWWPRWW